MSKEISERVYLGRLSLDLPVARNLLFATSVMDDVVIERISKSGEPVVNPVANELDALAETLGVVDAMDLITDQREVDGLWIAHYKTNEVAEKPSGVRVVSTSGAPLRFDARGGSKDFAKLEKRVLGVARAAKMLSAGDKPSDADFCLPIGFAVGLAYRGYFEQVIAAYEIRDAGKLTVTSFVNGTDLQPSLEERARMAKEAMAAFPDMNLDMEKIALAENESFAGEAVEIRLDGELDRFTWMALGDLRSPYQPYIEVEMIPGHARPKAFPTLSQIVSSIQSLQGSP